MRRIGMVAGLLLLVAVAWLLRPADSDPVPSPLGAEAPPAHASAPTAPPGAPAATAARASGLDGSFVAASLAAPEAAIAAAEADDARAGVLRGRLGVRQQPWQHPAGVEVRLTRSWLDSVVPDLLEPGHEAPARDDLRTTTDQDGRFAFRLVPPSTELFFLIGHGSEWLDYQKVPKLPRAGETIDLGDVWLDQRGEIVGRVVDAAGVSGLADVVVRAVDDPLLDGNSGFDDAFAAKLQDVEHAPPPGTRTGAPLPAWLARRDRMLPFPTATTDRDGVFRLRGVRPGNHGVFATWTLGAGRNSMALFGRSDSVLVAPGRTTDLGALRLKQRPLLQLRFVDTDDRAWVGARVAVLHATTGFGTSAASTDAEGRAWLTSVDGPRGRLLFGMTADGPWVDLGWPAVHELAWTRPEVMPAIVVPRPRPVSIRLADASGQRIAGGTVRAYTDAPGWRAADRLLPAWLQPRETGPGEFAGSGIDRTVFVAAAPGFAPAIATSLVVPLPILTMRLVPLQQAVVFVHTLRGEPVADASVRVQVHRNPELTFFGAQWDALHNDRVLLGRTDANGELVVPIWPTWFTFQADHRDFAPCAGPKLLPQPGERIPLLLLGGGAVHGTLTIEGQPAPAGLRVHARQRPPDGHPQADNVFLDERRAVTAADGTFTFRRLVAGLWELTPELPGPPAARGASAPVQRWPAKRLQLDEDQELHTTLEIQADWLAPVQVQGSVTQNGATVAGALVRMRAVDADDTAGAAEQRLLRRELQRHGLDLPPASAPWQRCTTDAHGTFRFRDLQPRTAHELRVDLPLGGRLQFVTRRIVTSGPPGATVQLDIALASGDVRLSCRSDGHPVANRMLRLRQVQDQDTETARCEVLLDGNGEVWLPTLPAGTWTIEPMHGGRCEPASFEVAPGGVAALSFAVSAR